MTHPKHYHFLFASLLSAILLITGWQPFGLVFTVFIGFVPLLWIEQKLREQQKNTGWFLLYAYLTFFLWNVGVTWWVWNASAEGAIMAFVLNSLLMCLPFMLYHRMQLRMESRKAQQVFIFLWIAFEYGHLNWEGTWPWLTLGNVFSSLPQIVQWYEYTGILGGSFWILYVNIKLLRYAMSWNERSVMIRYSKAFNLFFFTLFTPVFLSFYIANQTKTNGKPLNVLVVQPNIDPYTDKFDGMTPVEQVRKMLTITEDAIDSTTQLVCFPETALTGSINEDNLQSETCILLLKQFILAHPNVQVLTGADTYKFYPNKNNTSPTARRYNDNLFYDSYNTALLISNTDSIQVYHKSKLVPGVERLPYAYALGFIQKLTIDLGGTSGSLGSDKTSTAFHITQGLKIAPVICYESVFGEYVGTYIQKGANLICIITNDGWWGNTPGYAQHFDYARLRAIETRRFVARSANTGISGFIDEKGKVLSKTGWWVADAQKATVTLQTGETFYVRYGDYIGKIAALLALYYLIIHRKRLQ